jgi:hypothetical protein
LCHAGFAAPERAANFFQNFFPSFFLATEIPLALSVEPPLNRLIDRGI